MVRSTQYVGRRCSECKPQTPTPNPPPIETNHAQISHRPDPVTLYPYRGTSLIRKCSPRTLPEAYAQGHREVTVG